MTRLSVMILIVLWLVSGVAAQDDVIDVGETVESTLNTAKVDYTVTAESGQVLLINLRSTEFDSLLVVSDGRTELARDDDSGGDRNSLLRFAVPESGDYILTVTSYNGEGKGAFSLSVESVPVQQIAPGDTIEDTMSNSAVFLVDLEAGTTYVVSLASNEFDTRLEITDTSGGSLATDDDGGVGTNSLIRFTAPESGLYTITATGYSPPVDAAYTLSLESLAYTTLNVDEPLTFDTASGTNFFSFKGSAGDVVKITATQEGANDSQAELTLSDSNGRWLGSHTVFGDMPALIDAVILPQDDRYVLTYVIDKPATVTISVESASVPSLDEGPQAASFTNNQRIVLMSASAVAGQRYRLTVGVAKGSLSDTLMLTITQGDFQVTNFNVGPMTQVTLDFIPEQDGDLFFRLESYVFEAMSFEVTLEAVE